MMETKLGSQAAIVAAPQAFGRNFVPSRLVSGSGAVWIRALQLSDEAPKQSTHVVHAFGCGALALGNRLVIVVAVRIH